MSPDGKKLARNVTVSIFAVIVFLLIFEAFLVFTQPVAKQLNMDPEGLCVYAEDPVCDYALGPNFEIVQATREFKIYIKINSMGLRESREIAEKKPDGTTRVFFMGDSFIFGYGADQKKTIPAVLENELNKSGKFEVVNLGVPGYDFLKEKNFFQRFAYLEPDIVLMGANYTDLETIKGMDCFQGGIRHCLRQDPKCSPPQQKPFLQDQLEGSRAYSFFSEKIGSFGMQEKAKTDWEETKKYLEDLVQEIQKNNARPIIVLIASKEIENTPFAEKYFFERMKELAKEKSIKLIDTSQAVAENGGKNLYYPVDRHLTEEGIKVVSEEIAKELKNGRVKD